MELEHLYNNFASLGEMIKAKKALLTTLVKNNTKPTVTTTTVKPITVTPTILTKEQLTNNSGNVGIAPVQVSEIKPNPEMTLSKPVTAEPPLILMPNVEGGMKVATPSPVVNLVKKITGGLSVIPMEQIKTLAPTKIDNEKKAADAQKTDSGIVDTTKKAGFSISPLMIGGIVLAIIALYFLAKKKGGE